MANEEIQTTNKACLRKNFMAVLLLMFAFVVSVAVVHGFPPAPHHVIYGQVRDEFGHPIANTNAVIIFQTPDGVQISGSIVPQLRPGVNYELNVPMDSGITSDAYKPTALKPMVPFRIKVRIANVLYVPIEMTAELATLGDPGAKTRINLTLGLDSDGDGLPDAWEKLLLQLLGGNQTISDIRADDDADGDGLNNYDEYVAGTYAHDPADGFTLDIAGFGEEGPLLDFLAIRNRAYTLYGSADFQTWTPLTFRIPAEGPTPIERSSYLASGEKILRVEALPPQDTRFLFFKLQVH